MLKNPIDSRADHNQRLIDRLNAGSADTTTHSFLREMAKHGGDVAKSLAKGSESDIIFLAQAIERLCDVLERPLEKTATTTLPNGMPLKMTTTERRRRTLRDKP